MVLIVLMFASMICVMILEKYVKEKEEKKNNNIEIKKKKQKILIKGL